MFTLQELGLLEIFNLKTGDLSNFFTIDPNVMRYRMATFDDMINCDELTDMLNRLVPVLNDITELRRLEADNGDTNDYLSSITEIELYVSSIDVLHKGLTATKGRVKSPAFTSLTELICKRLACAIFGYVFTDLYDLANEALCTNANDVEHICLTHTLRYDKRTRYLKNFSFNHFRFSLSSFRRAHSRKRMSAPTARSTALRMLFMPKPLEPSLPGIDTIAGNGFSL